MNSVKIYSDNNCRNQRGELTFTDENRFLGYNTGCHTVGERSAWLSFANGQIEAQWFSDKDCKTKIDIGNRVPWYDVNTCDQVEPSSSDIPSFYFDADCKEVDKSDWDCPDDWDKKGSGYEDPYMGYRPQDDWMELVLWTTYLSTVFWLFGYLIYVPLGFFAIMIWV